jgi:hypothetical protein
VSASTFTVTLRHLAPDASRAGADLPDAELTEVPTDRLRRLIEGLSKLAPTVSYPTTPELRVTSPEGRFLVHVKEGKIKFTSWSLRTGGSELTPAEIFAAITGEELDEPAFVAATAVVEEKKTMPRGAKIALLAVVILGSNAVTAWMAVKPPPTLLPNYRVMDAEPASRLLASTAGDYEMGTAAGDRGLTIRKDGTVRWYKYGENKTIAEEDGFTTKPVEVQPARTPGLLAPNWIIDVKDPITVVFYGDTYRRKVK